MSHYDFSQWVCRAFCSQRGSCLFYGNNPGYYQLINDNQKLAGEDILKRYSGKY